MTIMIWIVAAIAVFLVHGFVLYCCVKVGKEADAWYEEMKERNANVK